MISNKLFKAALRSMSWRDWPTTKSVRSARNSSRRVSGGAAEAKDVFRQIRRVVIHHGHEEVLEALRQLFIEAADHAAVEHSRHPQFVGIRDDKRPEEVRREADVHGFFTGGNEGKGGRS